MTIAVLAVTLALSFGVFLLVKQTNTPSPELAFLTLILAPIFLNFTERLPAIIVQTKESKAKLPAVTADRFEQLFNDHLVKRLRKKKICKVVVVMDNLDRLQSEQVVEVLGSVKTYLEVPGSPFLFILPCDDEALRRHISQQYLGQRDESENERGGEQYASEFLRKFFNVTVSLAPFYEDEMWAFAKEQISLMRLSKGETSDTTDRLAQMVAFAFRDSPRRAKQFLNNLAARALVANARIEQGILNLGEESLDIRLLARLMIIEARWPATFAQISASPSHLGTLQKANPAGAAPGEDTVKQDDEGRPQDLFQFLLATDDITGSAAKIKAYIFLKQTEDEALLPNYEAFRRAVEIGDSMALGDLFAESEKDLQSAYLRTMMRILGEAAQQGLVGQARNATKAAIEVANAVPDLDRTFIADEIGPRMVQYGSVMDGVAQSPVRTVLAVLGSSPRQSKRRSQAIDAFIDKLASLGAEKSPAKVGRATEIVQGLAREIATLTNQQQTNTATAIGSYFATEPMVLDAGSTIEEAKTALIAPSTVGEFAKSLTKDQLDDDGN